MNTNNISVEIQEKINQFDSFLFSLKIPYDSPDKNKYTYTRVGKPGGSYLIYDGPDNSKFLNDYCEIYKILIKIRKEYNLLESDDIFKLNFSERQNEIGPLMLDFDFDFDATVINYDSSHINDYLKHRYTEDDIKKLVLFINETFYKYFGLEEDEIICYLQEKPYATIKYDANDNFKNIKDGFHLCYIYPLTSEHRRFIFNHVKSFFETKNILKHIGYTNKSIFDDAVLRNNWMLYGSYKSNDRYPQTYICKYQYNYWGEKTEIDYEFDELVNIFDIRQYGNYTEPLTFDREEYLRNHPQEIRDDSLDDIIVSNSYNPHTINKINMKFEPNKNFNINDYQELQTMAKTDESRYLYIKGLLNLLSPKRADDYDFWIHVCWALVSEGKNNENIYNLFLEFSKQSSKYNETMCRKLWNNARDELKAKENGKRNITLGTIVSYAKEDDINNFKLLTNLYYHSEQEKIIETHFDTDIADYLYKNYGHNHIYSRKTKIWYHFNGNLWVAESEVAPSLYNDITINFKKEFETLKYHDIKKLKKDICDIIAIDVDSSDSKQSLNNDKLKSKAEKILKERQACYKQLFTKLSSYNQIENNIIKACTMAGFTDQKIEDKMDSNAYLIGFNNGVYDLENKIFRSGKPEDYVSLCVNYDYCDYTGNEPVFEEIKNYFTSLFKNEEVRYYVLRYLASRLEGQNTNNQINIWTGPASNGKSVFTLLLNKLFGDYYGTLEANVITKARNNAEAPTPALMSTKGKRIVVIQEPEAQDQLNVGLLKQLSGGQDKINGRKLHCDIVSFIPQFEIIIICNDIPSLNNVDNGIARRLSVVKFNTIFVKDQNRPLQANEARANSNIEKYIKHDKWTQPLMWLLINKWYPEYRNNGLRPPNEVHLSTESYITSSDEVREFINEHYVIDKDNTLQHDNKPVRLSDLHNAYMDWAKSRGYIRKYRTQHKFGEHLIQIIGLTMTDSIINHLYRKRITFDYSDSTTLQ